MVESYFFDVTGMTNDYEKYEQVVFIKVPALYTKS